MAEQQVAKELLADSNWINKTQNIMQENVMGLFEKFYDGAHDIVYSSGVTTFIVIIVVLWLLDKLKNGYPTREESFGAVKYIISLCFIYATLSSFNAYTGVLSFLTIPENVITAIVSSIYQSQDFGEIVTESVNRVDNLRSSMWEYGTTRYLQDSSWSIFGFDINSPTDYLMSGVVTAFLMVPFWIFYIVFFILLIGIIIVIFFSKFTAFLILSTLPLIIPFLIFTRFRPYLWSWYKLYLSYAIIAPLAFIALNLAMNPITELEKFQNNIAELFLKQYEYLITGAITCLTAIFILKRIPSWINSVLGTQMESGSGGVAGGVIAGAVAGKTAMGGLVQKALGGSFIGGALRAFSSATGGGAITQIGKTGIDATINAGKDVGKIFNAVKTFRGGYATP
ncbi:MULTISPECIES: type IV secretion system protein [Campylobacter]|uniref:type IV secretion system protein n=1 Tax=Campylobacter TaxID=194 RepID=UPI0023F28CC8|nr:MULTISPECIES: type IV secretion system protein [Campylobacter]MCI6641487.1 type IV secretion system protein [Campylobacter sp.]MDD7422167.1 type IV secretion system protein [Campylobacter hominis]MDY3117828.1 type IV secretion system protein [Campylobacter hominis]